MADLTTLRNELSVLQTQPRNAAIVSAIYYKQKEIAAAEAKLRNPPVYSIALPNGAAVESKQIETNTLINDTNKLVVNNNGLTANSNNLINQTNTLLSELGNSPNPFIFIGNINGTVYSLAYPFVQKLSSFILTNKAAGSNTINVTIENGITSISIVQQNLELSAGDTEKDTSGLIIDKYSRIKITSTGSLDYYMVLESFNAINNNII